MILMWLSVCNTQMIHSSLGRKALFRHWFSRESYFVTRNGRASRFQKNSLVFLRNISIHIFLISLVFNYPAQKLPISYLGLPISSSKINKSLWSPLIDRMQRRLSGWKGKLISFGGRITMINALVAAIPMYFLSSYSLDGWKEKSAPLGETFFRAVHKQTKRLFASSAGLQKKGVWRPRGYQSPRLQYGPAY